MQVLQMKKEAAPCRCAAPSSRPAPAPTAVGGRGGRGVPAPKGAPKGEVPRGDPSTQGVRNPTRTWRPRVHPTPTHPWEPWHPKEPNAHPSQRDLGTQGCAPQPWTPMGAPSLEETLAPKGAPWCPPSHRDPQHPKKPNTHPTHEVPSTQGCSPAPSS